MKLKSDNELSRKEEPLSRDSPLSPAPISPPYLAQICASGAKETSVFSTLKQTEKKRGSNTGMGTQGQVMEARIQPKRA